MARTTGLGRRLTTGLAVTAMVTVGFCQPALAASPQSSLPATGGVSASQVEKKQTQATLTQAETISNLNIRSAAGLEHEVLEVLSKGSSVILSGKTDGVWHFATSDSVTGWVHGDYLGVESKVKAQSAKAAANLNLRDGSSLKHEVIRLLTQGDSLVLTGQSNGVWKQAVVGESIGWVHGDYLADSAQSSATTATKKSQSAPRPRGNAVAVSGKVTETTRGMVEAVNENFGSSHYSAVHGYRAGSKGHSSGKAADFMIRDYKSDAGIESGDAIAQYLIENRSELGINYVIWRDRIWLPTTGWTQYSGQHGKQFNGNWNDTTLHMDHVHAETH